MLVALGASLACGGGGGGGTGNPTTTIAKTAASSGDAQVGEVGTALANPLRVLIQEDGAPLAGANVEWLTASGNVGPSPATTDANGIATATWTLGNVAGPRTATATLAGATGSPVTFNATANPGPAAVIDKVAGDNQGALVNTNFTAQVQVRVEDQFGNPRPGTTVNWAGGGSAQPGTPSSVTNAQGIASVTVAAQNVGGAGTVVASVAGVVGTQTFNFQVGHRRVNANADVSFSSARNGTVDPAIDTIAVNQTMLWVNVGGGHTVRSIGVPSFTSSGNLTVYAVTFPTQGTYQYDCEVHPDPLMTGQVVVE
jgi:plastocyanin